MSKVLLREYYELCEGGVCQDLLTEAEKRFVAEGGMILSGVMQKSDTRNGNGRVYPHQVLMREVENYKKLVKEKRALGELDHPDDSVIGRRSNELIDFIASSQRDGAVARQRKDRNALDKRDSSHSGQPDSGW